MAARKSGDHTAGEMSGVLLGGGQQMGNAPHGSQPHSTEHELAEAAA